MSPTDQDLTGSIMFTVKTRDLRMWTPSDELFNDILILSSSLRDLIPVEKEDQTLEREKNE